MNRIINNSQYSLLPQSRGFRGLVSTVRITSWTAVMDRYHHAVRVYLL